MALSETERAELAKHGHYRNLKRGETLFASGDESRHCFNLIEGSLKVTRFDKDGTEHVLSVIRPSGFVGDPFARVARYDVIALTDCTLCMIPDEHYEHTMRSVPEFGRELFMRSLQDMMNAQSLLITVTRQSAMQRVARFLLTEVFCESGCECDLLLTRGEIASMLGLTIGSVSRQLTKLERDRVIIRKGVRRIRVTDANRLREIA